MSIATKEMRETLGWLGFSVKAQLLASKRVIPIIDELEISNIQLAIADRGMIGPEIRHEYDAAGAIVNARFADDCWLLIANY